jgi:hypothetical protein
MENELEDGQQQLTEEVTNDETQTTDLEEGGDADFDAGFAGTPTVTPEKPEAGQEGEKPQDQATAAENTAQEGQQPTATPAAPEYVQVTKDQLEELMARAREVDNLKAVPQRIDQAFGKLGGIERIIQGLQKQQTDQPQGEPLKLSEADFAELKQQFPEVAELQLKGMQRVLERIRIPGADPQAIDKVVGERTAAVRTELVDSRLDEIVDGDWRQEVNKPEFTDWINKQAADVQALADSDSLRDAATLLRKFKTFRNTPAPAPAQPTQAAPPTVKSRAIAAAVPPRGNQAVSRQPTADDEFDAGFKSG